MNSEVTKPYIYMYHLYPKLPSHPDCHMTLSRYFLMSGLWQGFIIKKSDIFLTHWHIPSWDGIRAHSFISHHEGCWGEQRPCFVSGQAENRPLSGCKSASCFPYPHSLPSLFLWRHSVTQSLTRRTDSSQGWQNMLYQTHLPYLEKNIQNINTCLWIQLPSSCMTGEKGNIH